MRKKDYDYRDIVNCIVTDRIEKCEFHYLDWVYPENNNSNEIKELSVKLNSKEVYLEEQKILLAIPDAISDSLNDDFGIVMEEEAYMKMNDEIHRIKSKMIFERIGNAASISRKKNIKGFKKIMFNAFGYDPGEYISSINTEQKLVAKILKGSNIIAQKGRRGPANFVIVNQEIGSIIQDSKYFNFDSFSDNTYDSGVRKRIMGIEKIGDICGLTVYINLNMGGNDNRMIFGAKSLDSPGIYLVENPEYIESKEIQGYCTVCSLINYFTVTEVGNFENLYYEIILEFDMWYTKIWKKFKKFIK